MALITTEALNLEPIRVDRKTAALMLGISVRLLDYRVAEGKITTRRDGKRVLIPVAELKRYAKTDHAEPARY
jgi:excisionase family DNA binding protein